MTKRSVSKDMMKATINRLTVLSVAVDPQWIDGNGHVSDRNYSKVFSDAEVAFLELIGADRAYRTERGGYAYTVESHLIFLSEMLVGDQMKIAAGLIDYNEKAIHLSFEMYNLEGTLCAHHETLILHVRKDEAQTPRVCAFAQDILDNIKTFEAQYSLITNSPYCKKPIGIRR